MCVFERSEKGMIFNMKNMVKVVFVIIATLVGAGFASGKEMYSFFFVYGLNGICGICISSFLICFVVYKVLKMCNANNIDNYQNFCRYIVYKNPILGSWGKYVAVWLNGMVNILLLVTFFIMISGFSSFLNQELYVNRLVGSSIVVILCYFTFQGSVEGLIKVSNYLIPILIFFLVFVSSKNLDVLDNYNGVCNVFVYGNGFNWVIKSILYSSYNCILLIPVLVTLKSMVGGNKEILGVSVISFFVILVLSLSVFNILLLGNFRVFTLEMPVIEIVKVYGEMYRWLYLFMIAISIYTTAISTGCGFLNGNRKMGKSYKYKSVIMCIIAIFLSQISFSVLVNLLYPILGIIGLLEVLLVLGSKGINSH